MRIRAYCEKGWGGIASSVIGNVRAERDDRGLVDVAGREAFVACIQGRARGVRAPEELCEPVAVHNDRRAPPLPPLSIVNFADVKLRRLAVARRPVVADVDQEERLVGRVGGARARWARARRRAWPGGVRTYRRVLCFDETTSRGALESRMLCGASFGLMI